MSHIPCVYLHTLGIPYVKMPHFRNTGCIIDCFAVLQFILVELLLALEYKCSVGDPDSPVSRCTTVTFMVEMGVFMW